MLGRSLASAFVLVASPGYAQDDEAARRAAAEAYIASPTQQEMLRGMLSPETTIAMVRAQFPGLPEEAMQQVATISREETEPVLPAMEEAMVDALVEVFSLAEIEAMDAFYRTREGAASALKTPTYMQTYLGAIGPELQNVNKRVIQRITSELDADTLKTFADEITTEAPSGTAD